MRSAGVTDVLEKSTPDTLARWPDEREDSHTREHRDCVEVYGYTIETAHGRTDIIFRNISNGYYGGSLSDLAETTTAITIEGAGWTRLTDDWTV